MNTVIIEVQEMFSLVLFLQNAIESVPALYLLHQLLNIVSILGY